VNLGLHAVIARHVAVNERPDVVAAVASHSLRPKEMEAVFAALGWRGLVALGPEYRQRRLVLLVWACGVLDGLPPGAPKDRLCQLALQLPLDFGTGFHACVGGTMKLIELELSDLVVN
jgi:hypothetical protein